MPQEEKRGMKMKKYKKILVSLLAGAMVFSMTACGSSGGGAQQNSGGSDAAQSSTDEGAAAAESADAAGTGESVSGDLKMIFWDSNQEPGLVQMAEGFMKHNPECKVTVETIPWDEYWTKLQAAAQGGDLPDIFVMHPDEVKNYAEGGILMDLTDVLSGDVANADNFPQYVVDDFKVGEGYYGIPKDIGTLGLFYKCLLYTSPSPRD